MSGATAKPTPSAPTSCAGPGRNEQNGKLGQQLGALAPSSCASKDHPRVCGEHRKAIRLAPFRQGADAIEREPRVGGGGETHSGQSREYATGAVTVGLGPSPQARGASGTRCVRHGLRGTTPAGARSTCTATA